MKRIVASVGLVAVGATGLQAALLPALTTESGKPWTVHATLRGFYDDNINTIPDNQALLPGAHRSSWGFQVSPGLEFAFPMEQTTVSFGYVYSFKYYENKPEFNADNYDQTHDFHAALTHAFSERYQLSARDSFVIGQEPDMLRAQNTFTTFQRIPGSNLRNYGVIDLSAQLTPEFGLDFGYANTYYSYADNQVFFNPNGSITASTSGLLDELDHVIHLDGRYQIQPETVGILGYQFRETDYIGDQPIGRRLIIAGPIVTSDERNARINYGYVGLDHNFLPDLTASVRGGANYVDYYNNPASQNQASPYAMASLKYTYLPGSYLEAGFSYDYSSSDVFSVSPLSGDLTLNAQSATVYATLSHRITPKLQGNIVGQFQDSTYYGGQYDGKVDKYYLVGLNLQYQFTPNVSAEVGYNYDKLDSEVMNTYDRNRVYVGVTGSY
jgi:Putative beta-barrel porin 2